MKKIACLLIVISLVIQGGNTMDARTKKLTDANYSPTIPDSEEAIRTQIDGSIQEVYDIVDEAKLDKDGDFSGSWHGIEKPVYAEPGLAGVVDALDTELTSHKADIATAHGINNKANKAMGETLTATLINGWTGTLNYSKNDLGQVLVKGAITAGTVVDNTVIATLPAEYTVNPISGTAIAGYNHTKSIPYSGIVIINSSLVVRGTNISVGDVIRLSHLYQT